MARYPQYAPDYDVRISGDSIPPALRASVIRISYQDGIEGADRVEMTLANERLQWLDHPLLQVDNGFALSLGYAGDRSEELFVGEITGVNASFPNSGMPTLTVVAHDFLQRLTHGAKDRAFRISIPSIGNFPLPDVAVVAIATATNLLIPDPDPIGGALSFLTTLATYLVAPAIAQKGVRIQRGESDFEFLSAIAKQNGWEMYIDHTLEPRGYVLKFQFLVQDYAPSLALKWGASLMEFTPRLTAVGDVFGVSATVWVDSLKMEFVIVLSWDYDRAAFNLVVYPGLVGDLDSIVGSEAAGKTISIKPASFALAPQKILSELLPRLNNRLTGTGSAVGDLRIKAGAVINLEGLGDQFSGLYRITSATHSIDSGGYRTSFEVRKEVWFGSIPVPKGAGGLLRVQGQRVG
jgi:uncharacterized protein